MSRDFGRIMRLCFLSMLFALPVAAQDVSNPILDRPDPFISAQPVNGRYLLLATTLRNDITIWSGPTVPTASTDAKVVYQPADLEEVSTPTLWQMEGRWWIYFSAREPGKEHGIYALESDTADPLGTYTFRGKFKLGRPAIDPSLLTVGGVNYLMFVTVDGGANEIHIIRLKEPFKTKGHESLLLAPKYPWEEGAGTTNNYPVAEGPTALYHAGNTFIVYSASHTATPVYCLGLLTFKGGNPTKRKSWIRSPQPVFSAVPMNGIYGPGRGTFTEDASGADWMLYAAKADDEMTFDGRETRAQRFTWNPDGSPHFGVPLPDGPIVKENSVP